MTHPNETQYRPETLALHAGYTPDPTTKSRAVPIYYTTSFRFDSAEHAAALFNLEQEGNIYTRIGNPTTEVFEKRIAALEGGIGALAVASGQAAETLALLSICKAGDEIIASTNIYGGTYNLLKITLPRLGIKTTFVDSTRPASIRDALTQKTRAIFVETLANPRLEIVDLRAVSAIARDAGVPLVVDNTAATCALCNPIKHGANVVIHSATKYIGGHGQAIGGVIVDGGNFPWDNGKYPEFTEPNPGYHGLKLYEALGPGAFIGKARIELLRDLGPALSPHNAISFISGLETLALRVERHCANALVVAGYLKDHPKVGWVRYPGLEGDPANALAREYFGGKGGGIVTFGVKGGLEAGKKLINGVNLWSLVANIGDSRSLIIHPASTTHQQLSEQEQASTGVFADTVRLCVGLEHTDDIIADLDQALAAV